MRRDQVGEATRRNDARLVAELPPDAAHYAVYLPRKAVDKSRLEAGDRVLADHAVGLDVVDLAQARRPFEQRVHRDLDAGREHASDVLGVRGDDVEVRRG